MKLLQNPIAVTLLAVAAAALIFKQIAWPMLQRSHWMQHTPVAAAATPAVVTSTTAPLPAQPAKSTGNPVAAVEPEPEAAIDESAAETTAARVAMSPRRDPFQSLLVPTNLAKARPSARQRLALSGVWMQTGSSLAVINNQVTGVGDSILEFTVESIESNRVWVEGPNGREAVEFRMTSPSAPANIPTNFIPAATPNH